MFDMHRRIDHLFFRCLHQQLRHTGLHPGQAALLMFLAEHDNTVTSQSALARAMHVSPAAIAMSLRSLERQGLVRRRQNPDDQRENRLSLTMEGKQSAEAIHTAMESIQGRAMEGIPKESLDTTEAVMTAIYHNLAKEAPAMDCENMRPPFPPFPISKEDEPT